MRLSAVRLANAPNWDRRISTDTNASIAPQFRVLPADQRQVEASIRGSPLSSCLRHIFDAALFPAQLDCGGAGFGLAMCEPLWPQLVDPFLAAQGLWSLQISLLVFERRGQIHDRYPHRWTRR